MMLVLLFTSYLDQELAALILAFKVFLKLLASISVDIKFAFPSYHKITAERLKQIFLNASRLQFTTVISAQYSVRFLGISVFLKKCPRQRQPCANTAVSQRDAAM
jgi:hypothetical protein